MTIHADWAKVLKQRYPHCFSPTLPKHITFSNGIIDGHIQLMGAYNVTSWDQFLYNQFVRPVTQLFNNGCSVVVLLFDNRLNVSPYKGMTQIKRCKRFQDVQFSKADQLPDIPPSPWIDHMMNRHFKDKVISLVCERIQHLVQPCAERTLIVDFKGAPKLYTRPDGCPEDISFLGELGESDIKFTRYVHMLGNSIVYATDGDYIPICLLYYTLHGIHENNNVVIYRQEANIGTSTHTAKTTAKKTTQVRSSRKNQHAQKGNTKTNAAATTAHPPRRKMEYIEMQSIFTAILEITKPNPKTPPNVAVLGFVSTMLLAGTDYSRSLPLVGPKRIIELFPSLSRAATASLAVMENELITPRPSQMTDNLVYTIYSRVFEKYLTNQTQKTIQSLLHSVQTSKLSDRSKQLLPDIEQIDTTCRNVTWVVHYWKDCINTTPDFSQPQIYGFVLDEKERHYTWTDKLPDTRKHNTESPVDPIPLITMPQTLQIERLAKASEFIKQRIVTVR
eukprot:3934805-Rhodomonas_salina.2